MRIFYARTKSILLLSALALLLIVLFCNYYGTIGVRNTVGTVDAQASDGRAVTDTGLPKDASPFETAKAYWNLSKKGDFQAIDALITKIPPSYWVECEETPSSKAFKRRRAERIARLPRIEASPDGKDYNFRDDLEAKSIGFLKQRAIDYKTSQFQDLEFVDQKVYGDEAMVFTKFRITDNYYGNPVFYMTRSKGIWRIFLESNRDYGYDTTDYYYASPRPKCPDKWTSLGDTDRIGYSR